MTASVTGFKKPFGTSAARRNVKTELKRGAHQRLSDLLEMGNSEPVVLHGRESSDTPGMWELAGERIDWLSDGKWFLVLLVGGFGSGWVLTRDEVMRRIEDQDLTLKKARKYLLLENEVPKQRFREFHDLLHRILGSDPGAARESGGFPFYRREAREVAETVRELHEKIDRYGESHRRKRLS